MHSFSPGNEYSRFLTNSYLLHKYLGTFLRTNTCLLPPSWVNIEFPFVDWACVAVTEVRALQIYVAHKRPYRRREHSTALSPNNDHVHSFLTFNPFLFSFSTLHLSIRAFVTTEALNLNVQCPRLVLLLLC